MLFYLAAIFRLRRRPPGRALVSNQHVLLVQDVPFREGVPVVVRAHKTLRGRCGNRAAILSVHK